MKSEIHHKHSPKRQQKRKRDENVLQGELRKLKPPTLYGEKFGEVAKMWLQEMKKHLQLHDYLDNQESRISIFNLEGKAYHWWEQLKQVEGLEERKIF